MYCWMESSYLQGQTLIYDRCNGTSFKHNRKWRKVTHFLYAMRDHIASNVFISEGDDASSSFSRHENQVSGVCLEVLREKCVCIAYFTHLGAYFSPELSPNYRSLMKNPLSSAWWLTGCVYAAFGFSSSPSLPRFQCSACSVRWFVFVTCHCALAC